MEITLGLVFVMIFGLCRLSSAKSDKDFKTVTFQVLKKNPALRRCSEATQKNEYVGIRVSELTGECQGLDRSWVLNQTLESGYAYAKKQFVNETFQPPTEITNELYLTIPGVLKTGARLDVSIANPQRPNAEGIGIYLRDVFSGEENYLLVILLPGQKYIMERYRSIGQKRLEFFPEEVSTKEVKISLLAQPDSITVLYADEAVGTYKPIADIAMLNEIQIKRVGTPDGSINILYSLQFTAN